MKKQIIIASMVCLSSCYSNWPALDKVSQAITCDMGIKELNLVAKKYKALGEFDELSNSYSLTKFDDAIGIAFNHKHQIMTIAKTKSIIGATQMTRHQGDVVIVKRCIKQ